MATDKIALAKTYGAGYARARSLTAPIPDYHTPAALDITVDGRTYNVLSFDIEGARSLLARAGFPDGSSPGGDRLQVPYHFASGATSELNAAILQQQWMNHLNIEVKLVPREVNVHLSLVGEGAYTGIAEYSSWPLYRDPVAFLDRFSGARGGNPSGWSDPDFTSDLRQANEIRHRTERLNQLAACERRLLAAMPLIPLIHSAFQFLCKPFVRGISAHLFEARTFKYVWIDRNWKAS
jgi:ABC-type oligopeptide transport system substrate-binding subunit